MSEQPAQGGGEDTERRSVSSLVHRTDLIVALIVWGICAILFWRTFSFASVPSSLAQNVQPTIFPRLMLISIALLTFILPFEYMQKRKQGIDLDSDRDHWPEPVVYITSAVMLFVIGIMPWLGTYVGLIIVTAALPVLWGERRLKLLVPYVLLFPAALLWLFANVLLVNFQPGIVGYLFR